MINRIEPFIVHSPYASHVAPTSDPPPSAGLPLLDRAVLSAETTVDDAPARHWLPIVGLGLLALSGLGGPVAYAAGPEVAVVHSVTQPTSPVRAAESPPATDSTQSAWKLSVESHNDSYPDPLGLTPRRFMAPGTSHTDDDGFTAGFGATLTRTRGDRQSVTQGRYDMVTERGGWAYNPSYGSRRTDVLELAHQENFRRPLSERTDLVYGLGGGIQAIGPLGGQDVQEWWHANGTPGREGLALQHNYTTDRVSYAPMVTGGVGLQHRLDSGGNYHLTGALETNAPLGSGLGAVRTTAGVEARPVQWLGLRAGASLSGVWSNDRALDFADVGGVRPGAYLSAEFKMTDDFRPYVWAETGGVRAEPQYGVGLSFTFGAGKSQKAEDPWLRPTWR